MTSPTNVERTPFFCLAWNVVNRKEYFEIPWAGLRAMVEPSIAKRSVIDHQDYFTNGKVVCSPAVDIRDDGVLTADSEVIPYDYLVIATGHMESVPRAKTERLAQYQGGKTFA